MKTDEGLPGPEDSKNPTTHGHGDHRIFLVGDSLVASYPTSRAPLTGWGQVLSEYFVPGKVVVRNHAISGYSTKNFIGEKRWDLVMDELTSGDTVLIQFTGNDQKSNDPNRYADPAVNFPANLRKMIAGTIRKGANPILVIPPERRGFDQSGSVADSHGPYPAAIRAVAAETGTILISLRESSMELYRSLGLEGSKQLFLWLKPGENPNYPAGIEDNTHFCETGAREMARIVAEGIRDSGSSLSKLLKL